MAAARRLDGRVAIVTGAAGGIGTAIREILEREGSLVVPVDIAGDGCVIADIGTEAGNRAAIEAAIERHGRLDTLVLNAGVQFMAPIAEFPEEQWDRLMNVMVKGPFFAIKHAWPHLTAQPGGRIVFTASLSSFRAEQYKSAYVAAKHAVLGLMRVAALEGAPHGLTANAVAPGWVRTPLVESQIGTQMELHGETREQVMQRFVGGTPGQRFVEPTEVAETIAFLASDAASALNGTCVTVDLATAVI